MNDRPGLPWRFVNTAYLAVLAFQERRVPFWPRERIERLQQGRLRSIIHHAYDTVPFYRQVMGERRLQPQDFKTAADLEALPLIDGLWVRENSEQFLSSQYIDRPRLALQTSSAYTHVQKLIHWDYAGLFRRLICAERDRVVLNRLLRKGWKQAQLFLLPENSVSLKMRRFWDGQTLAPRNLAHRYFVSPERPFDEVVAQINMIKPQVVFSYGSYAEEFFHFLAETGPQIALPRVWMYGGDMLSETGRELIERNFGCIVYSTYQSVETGKIGFQCEHREGFHLNIDLCALRLVDESGQNVKLGQEGEVVISNLYNRAMVLLNYRLGDLGILATNPCSCGRGLPLLEQLKGRVSEKIYLPNGRRIDTETLVLSFKDELGPSLLSQLSQPGPNQVLWRIVPSLSMDRESLKRRVLEKSRSIFGDVEIRVEFLEKIPRTLAGKFFRVVPLKTGN
jgi:phenylacetate-CoA ligase